MTSNQVNSEDNLEQERCTQLSKINKSHSIKNEAFDAISENYLYIKVENNSYLYPNFGKARIK